MTDQIPPFINRTATLLQAAKYAAWALPPLEGRVERIEGYPKTEFDQAGQLPSSTEREGLELGARQLLKLLATGELLAHGVPMMLTEHRISIRDPYADHYNDEVVFFDPNTGLPDAESFVALGDSSKSEPIEPAYWDMERIDWQKSFVWDGKLSNESADNFSDKEIVAYGNITIGMDDLLNAFKPKEEPSALSSTGRHSPSYRSPFLALMLRAEEHFGERVLNAKKAEIEDWLSIEGPKIDGGWTRNKTRSMATFLRPVESGRGGNRKART
jgi:hypothetical protein